jgi:hypothetical protein
MKYVNRLFVGGLVVAALVLSLSVPVRQVSMAAGAILYVDADASGANDGTSWEDAFTDLQPALEAALSGDQIWVAEGTYKPSVEYGGTGSRYQSFQMKNGVAIYGGFAGTESLLEQRDWVTHVTIFSGDLNGDDGPDFTNYAENSYHVFFHPAALVLDSSAILDGFTIRGGNANDVGPHTQGGGMYNYYNSPTLTNVLFSLNMATFGGGMFNDNLSEPVLTAVTFTANYGGAEGGGMANYFWSSPRLTDVVFNGNDASEGGGMYNYYYSSPVLTNVVFFENTAGFEGSGMSNLDYSNPRLVNVTFARNDAGMAGGMYNDNSDPILINAILWDLPTVEIYNNSSSTPHISYSDLKGGCPTYAICDQVINLDPQFVDAASGDLRLQLTSPAIDAGDNTAVPAGVIIDLDGNLRFVDIFTVPDTGNGTAPIVDMGAYEAFTETIAPTVVSILRIETSPTNASSVNYAVTFSESVTGVTPDDFALSLSGVTGASVTEVSGGPTTYTVAVATGSGDGTLRLDIPDSASITDTVGNPLIGLPYTGGASYTIDKTAPAVISILLADPNPTTADSVSLTITFSEEVSGVAVEDFSLYASGALSGSSVTGVSGSGATYTVTVAVGSGAGLLRLDIPDTATITDLVGNPLSGLPYQSGQAYTILLQIYLPVIAKHTP